ncbi:tRNA pseudouridine synthase B (fragment) [Capnocytophaga canimorsus]
MRKTKRYFKAIKRFINEIPRVDKAIILTLLCMFFCILSLSLLQLKSVANEIMLEMINTNEPFTDIEKF